MKDLLEHKKKMKKRKPHFVQTDTHWKKRLKAVWRRPRGLHNKMRLGRRSYPATVEVGYRSPRKVRGLSKEGKQIVLISNLKELKKQDSDMIVEIKASVGNKKRLVILAEAKKMDIKIKNNKTIDGAIESIKNAFVARKSQRKKRFEDRAKKDSKKKKVKKEEKTIDEKLDDKEKEKKERDRTLTKRV